MVKVLICFLSWLYCIILFIEYVSFRFCERYMFKFIGCIINIDGFVVGYMIDML